MAEEPTATGGYGGPDFCEKLQFDKGYSGLGIRQKNDQLG
jgi:hypothetical protein